MSTIETPLDLFSLGYILLDNVSLGAVSGAKYYAIFSSDIEYRSPVF